MLRKKIAVLLLSAAMAMTMLSGCGDNTAKEDEKAATEDQNKDDASEAKEEEADEAEKAPVEDGEYWVVLILTVVCFMKTRFRWW